MDRQTILGIMGQLPQETLLKMLAVAGNGGGEPAGADVLGELALDAGGAPNKIQSWGDRKIPYQGGSDRPAIADKAWAEGANGVGQALKPHGGALDDSLSEGNLFLQTGGGS